MQRLIRYLINWVIGSTLILFLFDYLATIGANNVIDLEAACGSMYMLFMVYFIICFLFDKPVKM
jgi:hypothetical protein